jgi:type 1 glutamine amidotransferase
MLRRLILSLTLCLSLAGLAQSAEKKKLLLIGCAPDNHPRATHEYMPAMRIIKACLEKSAKSLEVTIVKSDENWLDGPKLLREADGAVMFVAEGARWTQADLRRAQALLQLAKRGGGLTAIHWGTGTRDAKNIDGYLKLLGACHGGPDRKYKVLTTDVTVVDPKHPITRNIASFRVRDEFYYKLKTVKPAGSITPLLTAKIEGADETVCWSWERPDGGRSFGFTGLHFHKNWSREDYRRLIAQGILWSMKQEIPAGGLDVTIDKSLFELPKPAKK